MLRSQYDHFTLPQTPKYIKWVNHPTKIQFFSDELIPLNKNPENSALLIEPHSIQPRIYDYIERNWQDFKYIFTHDGYLLDNIPNTKRILFGGVYEFNDIPKTKDISFCSSRKTMCDLHRRRLDLAYELEKYDIVDCMGTYNGGKYVTTKEIYAPYRFSIIIENWIDDYWFTEKICNCYAYPVSDATLIPYYAPLGEWKKATVKKANINPTPGDHWVFLIGDTTTVYIDDIRIATEA